MCPKLGMYGTSEIPRNMWEFFNYFPKYLVPQPFLSSFLVCLLFASAVIPCPRAAGTNAFAFKCFQQIPPRPPPNLVAVSMLGEFWINANKDKTFELVLQRANQTGQNKQAQFFKNKIHSTSSDSRNLYLECRLLSSRLPLSKGVGDGTSVSQNTIKLTYRNVAVF